MFFPRNHNVFHNFFLSSLQNLDKKCLRENLTLVAKYLPYATALILSSLQRNPKAHTSPSKRLLPSKVGLATPVIMLHPTSFLIFCLRALKWYILFFSRFTSPTSPSKRTLPSTAAVVSNSSLVQQNQNNNQQQQQRENNLPLPDSRSMDWNSLVNTATKAINTDDETTIVDLEANHEAAASKNRKLPEKR